MNKTRVVVVPLDSASSTVAESLAVLMQSDQDQFVFEAIPGLRQLHQPDLDDAYSWEPLHTSLKHTKDELAAPVVIGVLSAPIEKNWFSHSDPEGATGVISTADWAAVSDLPVHVYVANAIVQTLISILAPGWQGHDEALGCLGDFCQSKADIVAGIRSGSICNDCADVIRQEIGQEKLDAVVQMLTAASKSSTGA